MSTYKIPEWLEPIKNDWKSEGVLLGLLEADEVVLSSWFREVKPRLKSVKGKNPRNGQTNTLYQIKNVWALARAHGVNLKLGNRKKDRARVEELERTVSVLRDRIDRLLLESACLRQDVVNVQAERREEHSLEARELIRLALTCGPVDPRPGVYFLFGGSGEIVYVGQSKSVSARLAGHRDKDFTSVKMIPTDSPLVYEGAFISLLKPKYNIINGRYGGIPIPSDQ